MSQPGSGVATLSILDMWILVEACILRTWPAARTPRDAILAALGATVGHKPVRRPTAMALDHQTQHPPKSAGTWGSLRIKCNISEGLFSQAMPRHGGRGEAHQMFAAWTSGSLARTEKRPKRCAKRISVSSHPSRRRDCHSAAPTLSL